MFELNQYLEKLDREGTPIRTSLVGAGSLGSGLVAQINKTPGMEIDIVVGIKIKNAIKVLVELSGIDNSKIVVCNFLGGCGDTCTLTSSSLNRKGVFL
jgi:predicted homoserine dehydrogenase-like protein